MNEIAILLSTYNGERYIIDQLRSLEEQSYRNFDLYIRDDSSSDNTLGVINEFLQTSSMTVHIFTDGTNLGAAQNFATLLKDTLIYKNYRYFMFCDQDDIWLPHKVEITLAAMKQAEESTPSQPILVHSDLEVVDESLNTIAPSYWSYQKVDPRFDTLNSLLIQNVITGCTVMINRPLAEYSPLPQNIIMHDWWLGLLATSFGKIVTLPQSTILYRQHSGNNIGASTINISTIHEKIDGLLSFSFDKYIMQAKSLLDPWGGELSADQREVIEAFVSITELSWVESKITLLKYNFSKHNWTRNIGLFLCK